MTPVNNLECVLARGLRPVAVVSDGQLNAKSSTEHCTAEHYVMLWVHDVGPIGKTRDEFIENPRSPGVLIKKHVEVQFGPSPLYLLLIAHLSTTRSKRSLSARAP